MDEDGASDEPYEDVIYDDEVEEVIPIVPHDQEEGILRTACQYLLWHQRNTRYLTDNPRYQ